MRDALQFPVSLPTEKEEVIEGEKIILGDGDVYAFMHYCGEQEH